MVHGPVNGPAVFGGRLDAGGLGGRTHGGDVVAGPGHLGEVGDGTRAVGTGVVAEHDEVGVDLAEGRVVVHGVSSGSAPGGRLVVPVELVDEALGVGPAGDGG